MARYAHLPSGKVASTLDALPALPHDPDTERRVACGFYNDNGREISSDTSERGTSEGLRLAADGTEKRDSNDGRSERKSLEAVADRSSLAPVGSDVQRVAGGASSTPLIGSAGCCQMKLGS